jgi:hypothetical protein
VKKTVFLDLPKNEQQNERKKVKKERKEIQM